ncbi:hypothetical protein [Microcoleus vaginatus]
MVAGVPHEINNPVILLYGKIVHVNQDVLDLFNLIEVYQTYSPGFAA